MNVVHRNDEKWEIMFHLHLSPPPTASTSAISILFVFNTRRDAMDVKNIFWAVTAYKMLMIFFLHFSFVLKSICRHFKCLSSGKKNWNKKKKAFLMDCYFNLKDIKARNWKHHARTCSSRSHVCIELSVWQVFKLFFLFVNDIHKLFK